MNWIDLIIILFLLMAIIDAFKRPFLSEVLDLFSFILSFFLSFRYYNLPAKLIENQFSTPHGLSLVLGFMMVWFLSEFFFYFLVGHIVAHIPRQKILHNQILSTIPAFLKSLIIVALFLVLIATFPIQPNIKKGVQESRLGSYILSYAYKLEKPLKQVFGGVANDTLTFLTIEPKTNERLNLGFQTNKFSVDEIDEVGMISLVNQERKDRGIPILTFDGKLREVGRAHSSDMFVRGYFSHYSPDPDSIGAEGKTVTDRAEQFNVDYLVIGENLAFAPNLELAHNGLMNSPGHKANILSTDFTKIGIGVMNGGIYGKMYTQVFTN